MCRRIAALIAGISLAWVGAVLAAEGNDLPFNVNEVIEDVAHRSVRDGEFVIGTNTSYMAVDRGSQAFPSVTFDGTNYLVVWVDSDGTWGENDARCIHGARVGRSGMFLGSGAMVCSYFGIHPSAAFDGTNHLVVWSHYRDGSHNLYGARVDQSGVVLDPAGIAICTAAGDQLYPFVAFGGTDYLVVWEDGRSGSGSEVYGARVDQSGVVVDSFAVWPQSRNQRDPAIAYGTGDQLLVIYSGWTESINDDSVDADCIWGKFLPYVGVAEWTVLHDSESGLLPSAPDPFCQTATIRYSVVTGGHVSMKVYDSSGRLVRTLIDEEKPAGFHIAHWDGTDQSGQKVGTGIYCCTLVTGNTTRKNRMILLR